MAGREFNPKCNQTAAPQGLSKGIPSCADVAEAAMKKHAEYRAQQKAFEEAKAAAKTLETEKTKRWLRDEDLL
jgi:hypothetical protein